LSSVPVSSAVPRHGSVGWHLESLDELRLALGCLVSREVHHQGCEDGAAVQQLCGLFLQLRRVSLALPVSLVSSVGPGLV
jgi:hypothetical protein